MINSYDELYVDDFMESLGVAFYLSEYFKLGAKKFLDLFIASGIAAQIENGNPKYLAGRCGSELYEEVLKKTGLFTDLNFPDDYFDIEGSAFWIGWTIAHYQWQSGKHFTDIRDMIGVDFLYRLYPSGHCSSEEWVCIQLDEIMECSKRENRLKSYRKAIGISQKELSEISGVNIRTIRAYEQGSKDLNNAGAMTVYQIAKSLKLNIDDLIEY